MSLDDERVYVSTDGQATMRVKGVTLTIPYHGAAVAVATALRGDDRQLIEAATRIAVNEAIERAIQLVSSIKWGKQ